MGVLSDVFAFGREVLQLADKVSALERGIERLEDSVSNQWRDHERRLARIEALIEMAQRRPLSLPKD